MPLLPQAKMSEGAECQRGNASEHQQTRSQRIHVTPTYACAGCISKLCINSSVGACLLILNKSVLKSPA